MSNINGPRTMNFFQHQETARKKTGLLVFLFVLAVIAIFLAIHTLIAFIVMAGSAPSKQEFLYYWLDPKLLMYDLGGVFLLIGGGSLLKIASLSALQGSGIAESLGGRRVFPQTTVFRERQLLNIVEEMAIASGIHVPNVYILENEKTINAFAAGFTPNTSVVAVTDGALTYLNRDELQGVIAHEFSHILNGDTRINLRLIGVLFGLEMIVILGMLLCRSIYFVNFSSSDDSESRGGGSLVVLGIVLVGCCLVVIGWVGVLFSNLIRAAVSRQREFLADASAVQFTRNPEGIGHALMKIGCPTVGSSIDNSRSVESCHLFIGSIFKPGFFASLFDSHPDLTVRIKRILPSFTGVFPTQLSEVSSATRVTEGAGDSIEERRNSGLNRLYQVTGTGVLPSGSSMSLVGNIMNGGSAIGGTTVSGRIPMAAANVLGAEITAAAMAQSVGALNKEKLDIATELVHSIPDSIREMVRDRESVKLVLYSLMMPNLFKGREADLNKVLFESPVLQKQFDLVRAEIKKSADPNRSNVTMNQLINLLKDIPLPSRIPVVELALPTVRTFDYEEYRLFRNNLIELIKADNKVELFEYTVQHYLIRDLDVYFKISKPPKVKYKAFSEVEPSFRIAISYLAYSGSDNMTDVSKAFNSAYESFYMESKPIAKSDCTPGKFGAALNDLAVSSPALKQKLLTAFYCCAANDGVINEAEGELLRAISAVLDTPMPQWSQNIGRTDMSF